ncbi:MAG: hypothetical protein QOH75_460 [Actinomycetota bacterium]|nr:hypothetical protein [Actinomycetota bacterium]
MGLGMVAAVGLAVGLPQLSLHADQPAGQPMETSGPSAEDALGLDAFDWPLRGDLADDEAFVDGAMRRLATDVPGSGRPLFAGRLPDGSRLLLATGDVPGRIAVSTVRAVHVAARHASTTGRVSSAVALTDPAQGIGWATVGRDGRVYAVVLGPLRPLRLELSGRVDFGSDGTPTRRWVARSSEEGTVVTDLGSRTDPAVAVRSIGLTPFVPPVLIPISGRAVTPPGGLAVSGVRAAGYGGPDPHLLVRGLVAMTDDLLDLGPTSMRVIWSGAPWRGRRLALVLITRPDGGRLQAVVGEQAGSWFPAGVRVLPTQEPADIPWLLEPFSAADPTLLLCPTGPGSLDYKRPGHSVSRVPIAPDGVATLLEPGNSPVRAGGALARVRGRDGTVLLSTRLPTTGFDDPLAVSKP